MAQARDLLRRGVYSSLSSVGETLTLADIAAAADSGDKLALGLLTEAGERLGEAISMALNLLGLDLVVLGGALVQGSPVVVEAAMRTVQLRVLPIVPRERRLVRSTGTDTMKTQFPHVFMGAPGGCATLRALMASKWVRGGR